jgi:hypothetical protein
VTREQKRIRDHWFAAVLRAVMLRDDSAAYLLTLAYVERLRELGVVEASTSPEEAQP